MTKIELYIYNVSKFSPVESDYDSYGFYKDAKDHKADIYVIGLQEVPNSEVSGIVVAQKTWYNHITRILNDCGLTLIYHKYMLSNLLLVFSDIELLKMIKNVQTRTVGYTLRGTLGYKGTLGVRIQLRNNTNLVLLTCHFTHGDENASVRFKQFEQGKYCMFDDICKKDSTIIFWMGDFNSRMNDDSTMNCTMASKTDKSLFKSVRNSDQLYLAMYEKKIFHDFVEPEILFPPTYRFIVKTDVYDIARRPSWCDRILVKNCSIDCKNIAYDADLNMLNSDHLPVYALYEIPDLYNDNNLSPYLCHFQDIPWWTSSVYFMCYFHFRNDYYDKHGSRFDWIGFFKYPIKNISLPEYWMYMAATYESDISDNDKSVKKKYVAEASSLTPGDYIVAYYSVSYNACIGFSNVFTVKTN